VGIALPKKKTEISSQKEWRKDLSMGFEYAPSTCRDGSLRDNIAEN
jgi:hypothetical protein